MKIYRTFLARAFQKKDRMVLIRSTDLSLCFLSNQGARWVFLEGGKVSEYPPAALLNSLVSIDY